MKKSLLIAYHRAKVFSTLRGDKRMFSVKSVNIYEKMIYLTGRVARHAQKLRDKGRRGHLEAWKIKKCLSCGNLHSFKKLNFFGAFFQVEAIFSSADLVNEFGHQQPMAGLLMCQQTDEG
jgi:hypothetical protein